MEKVKHTLICCSLLLSSIFISHFQNFYFALFIIFSSIFLIVFFIFCFTMFISPIFFSVHEFHFLYLHSGVLFTLNMISMRKVFKVVLFFPFQFIHWLSLFDTRKLSLSLWLFCFSLLLLISSLESHHSFTCSIINFC